MGDERSIEIPEVLAGQRLDRLISLETGLSRSIVTTLIEHGTVRVDGEPVTQRSLRLEAGQTVWLELPEVVEQAAPAADPTITFDVLHEDEHVVVIDKPAELIVHAGAGHPDGTLVNGLLHQYPEIATVGQPDRPGIVHRLDHGTSGTLVVARTQAAYEGLTDALGRHDVERVYWTLVREIPATGRGTIDAPIGRSPRRRTSMAIVADGKPAVTHYETVETFATPVDCAVLDCRLETGRTHQIRVHLTSIGHPVVGDRRYGRKHGPFGDLDRLALHARRLGFSHPVSGEAVVVDAPLPAVLVALHASLGQS